MSHAAKPYFTPEEIEDLSEEGECWLIQVGMPDGSPSTHPEIVALEEQLNLLSDNGCELSPQGRVHSLHLRRIDQVYPLLCQLRELGEAHGVLVYDELPISDGSPRRGLFRPLWPLGSAYSGD